jgi:hypothetical protein
MKKFKWADYPTTEAQFEALMSALDTSLNAEGLAPWQRPMHISRKLREALKWSGNIFPPRALAEEPGFTGQVLMAKAHRWYEQVYGEKLKTDFAYGHVPVRLGNNTWRVRASLCFGTVRFFADPNLENHGVALASPATSNPLQQKVGASINVLTQVEGLSSGMTVRLSAPELRQFLQFYGFLHINLQWRDKLPKTELFTVARGDYDGSTAAVLAGDYVQARWGAQQAVEKTLKGLLKLGSPRFSLTGKDGHDLKLLGEHLKDNHGISIDPGVLTLASCSTAIRYGKPSSLDEALNANHAVLGILEQIRKSTKATALLGAGSRP